MIERILSATVLALLLPYAAWLKAIRAFRGVRSEPMQSLAFHL
jgi:hypothetical protein